MACRLTEQQIEQAGVRLTVMDCFHCNTVFAIESSIVRTRRQDHQSFFCPHGHRLVYPVGETSEQTIARLRSQLDEANRQAHKSELKATDAIIAADRLVADRDRVIAESKRLKHRVACGVCPHCQRTFKQLAAHMKAKHSERRVANG